MSAMFLTWYTVCDWLVGGDELPLVHFTVSAMFLTWHTVCDWLVGGDEFPLVHFTVSGRVVS